MEIDPSWLKHRKYTMIGFAMQNLLLGMEYSLTFLTLWLYINEMIDTNSPKLIYSLVSVSYLVSTTIFTPIVGLIVDSNRNVRYAFACCNFFLMFGNILYSMHYSPWFLLMGRFTSGVGGALRAVIGSEIVRSYPSDERNRLLSLMSLLFSSGFIFGPGVNFIFANVDVWIGSFHLKTINSPGVFMAVLAFIMIVLTFVIITDLSKKFDFKAYLEKNMNRDNLPERSNTDHNGIAKQLDQEVDLKNNSDEVGIWKEKRDNQDPYGIFENSSSEHFNEKTPLLNNNGNINKIKSYHDSDSITENSYSLSQHSDGRTDSLNFSCNIKEISIQIADGGFWSSTISTLKLTKALYSHPDTALILFSTMFVMFSIVNFDMWLPLLVIDTMHLSLTEMNILVFGAGIFCALILVLIMWKPASGKVMVFMLYIAMFGLAMLNGIFISGEFIHKPSIYMQIFLGVLYALGFGGAGVIPDVFFVTSLAGMVHSDIQTYCESVRCSMYSFGSLIALVCAAFVYDYVIEFAAAYIVILMFICLMFFIRRKSFINPTLIL